MSAHQITWGVMAALPEELGDLFLRMTNPKTSAVAGRTFTQGEIEGQSVVAVVSRIGKVAAALSTAILVEHFKVDRVVFVGVAGGLEPRIRRGDVVVATQVVQHDLSAWPLFPPGEIPLLGKSLLDCDPHLTRRLHQAAQAALGNLAKNHQLHLGLVASGDQFIAGHDMAQTIRQRYPLALAVEMEGAAMAQVCVEYRVPFGVVRTISDLADDDAAWNFQSFLRDLAAPLASQILTHLFASE